MEIGLFWKLIMIWIVIIISFIGFFLVACRGEDEEGWMYREEEKEQEENDGKE